jgi:signal peptidase II
MQAARGAPLSGADITRPRRIRTLLIVAGLVYAADQVTKYLAVRELTGRAPVEIIDGLLQLRLVRNPGAAFGLAEGATVVFSLVAVVVAVAILRMAARLRSGPWALALGLLLGGALGNLTDRLLRQPGPLRGHVVDFLELPYWPVFNVADMAIVGAAIGLVVLGLTGRRYDGSREGQDDPAGDASHEPPPPPEERV